MNARPWTLQSWHDEWSGLKVAVLGVGATGFAAADTLVELGADVRVYAERGDDDRERILQVLGVPVVIAPLQDAEALFADARPELIIVSPGIPPHQEVVRWAREQEIAVWGDLELAWRLRDKVGAPAEWLMITGTNGKTTTTQLTEAMLLAGGKRAVACGNIGTPILDVIRDPNGFEFLVIEVSSAQLEYSHELHPYSSVCLNVAEDHHDWHGSAEAYRAAKAKVYANAKVACVYNRGDRITESLVEEADVADGCRAIGFGLVSPGPSDLGVVEDLLVDRAFHEDRHHAADALITIDALATVGLAAPHLMMDVLAAAALARSVGVTPAQIQDALLHFRLDAHRVQVIATAGGVTWIDDSKATNPHAAAASLITYPTVIWIVGGLFKGVDVSPLIVSYRHRLRGAVLIGKDRQALREAFERHAPDVPLFEVEAEETEDVMPTAVRLSAGIAQSGDAVILAPAAASMDQFTNYADRGNRFQAAVQQYLGGGGNGDDTAASSDGTR